MKKTFTVLCLLLMILSGCQSSAKESLIDEYKGGSPWLYSTYAGNIDEDTSASLKDDFYLYVNKDKMLDYVIPEGRDVASTILDLEYESTKQVGDLIKSLNPSNSEEEKNIYNYYNLQSDLKTRDALGIEPLRRYYEEIKNISSLEELNNYFLKPYYEQLVSIIGYAITPRDDDNNKYIVVLLSGDLSLGDSSEYEELSEYGARNKEGIKQIITYIADRLGMKEDEQDELLKKAFEFESLIAPSILTYEEQLDPGIKDYVWNPTDIDIADEMTGDFPLKAFVNKALDYEVEEVDLYYPEYFECLGKIYKEENIELIKAYLVATLFRSVAPSLDSDALTKYNEVSAFITGNDVSNDIDLIVTENVLNTLPWEIGQIYSQRYATNEDKEKITAMLKEIVSEYKVMLEENDFLSLETKKEAISKLDNFGYEVLYPEDFDYYCYPELNILGYEEGGNLFKAASSIVKSDLLRDHMLYDRPVRKGYWYAPPTKSNAAYSLIDNTIYIYNAICQGDIYNSDMPYEVMLGRLGTIMGHEISHAFDVNGSQYDANGMRKDWWNKDDKTNFDEKTKKLINKIDSIIAYGDTHFNGTITCGEVCADMGGVAVCLRLAKKVPDFDYDLFFRSYAELWCEKGTLSRVERVLKNEHPATYVRVNLTLQQFDEFIDLYDIKPGDNMYLAKEDRVAIWR